MLNTAWYLQGDFLYTVLVVAFNESIKSATRITAVYSFASVLTGVVMGAFVYFFRRLKLVIVAGTILFMVAFGILIYYRGGSSSSSHAGIIGAQVLLGIGRHSPPLSYLHIWTNTWIAGGMFPYPAQTSIQAATKHERKLPFNIHIATSSLTSPQTSPPSPVSSWRPITSVQPLETPSQGPSGTRFSLKP